jgi:hypothetical protein
MRLRGINPGKGRQPLSAEHEVRIDKIERQLACLMSEEGLAEPPVTGCPVEQPVDPDQVGRIVKGVLDELKQRGIA